MQSPRKISTIRRSIPVIFRVRTVPATHFWRGSRSSRGASVLFSESIHPVNVCVWCVVAKYLPSVNELCDNGQLVFRLFIQALFAVIFACILAPSIAHKKRSYNENFNYECVRIVLFGMKTLCELTATRTRTQVAKEK